MRRLDIGDLIQQNVLVYIQNIDCTFYIGINDKNKDRTLLTTMKEHIDETHLF